MRTALTLIILLCIGIAGHAQMIERQVIGSAGSLLSKGDMRLSTTTGEAIIGSKAVSNTRVLSGFHSKATTDNVSIRPVIISESGIFAYPNPFQERITVAIPSGPTPERLDLYSGDGRLIRSGQGSSSLETFDLAPGYYILQISLSDNRSRRIPLFKH